MKLVGLVMAIAGWLIPVLSLVLTQSMAVRMTLCIAGLAVSLFGILVVMNKAHLKDAIWKA
jgi:hypothetical protein